MVVYNYYVCVFPFQDSKPLEGYTSEFYIDGPQIGFIGKSNNSLLTRT